MTLLFQAVRTWRVLSSLVDAERRGRQAGSRGVKLTWRSLGQISLALTTAAWVRENEEFVEWVQPDAGALCCVRLKPAVFTDDAVSRFYDALAREGVRVANGSWFGDEARVFRVGFGLLSTPDLTVALTGLAAALKQTARAAT